MDVGVVYDVLGMMSEKNEGKLGDGLLVILMDVISIVYDGLCKYIKDVVEYYNILV